MLSNVVIIIIIIIIIIIVIIVIIVIIKVMNRAEQPTWHQALECFQMLIMAAAALYRKRNTNMTRKKKIQVVRGWTSVLSLMKSPQNKCLYLSVVFRKSRLQNISIEI